ncbi:mitochondrial protein, partial [Phytophthora palmivora]
TRGEGDSECIVCLYVDDMLTGSREKDIIASVKAGIAEKFRIKDLGRARFILGIEIDYDMERKALAICQRAYTESLIKTFGQENAKPALTPLDPSVHLTKNDEPQADEDKVKMKSKRYRSLVGRPDTSKIQRHWDAGIKVVRYLLKTKDVAITYDGRMGTELTAYSDADWAGNSDDRRSVTGVMLMMCVIASRKLYGCDVYSRTLEDIGAEQHGPTVIYEDSQGAMALAKNVGYQARTDIRYHFIREKIASGEVELTYEESKNQLADFLNKDLSTETLRYLLKQSNVGPKLEISN